MTSSLLSWPPLPIPITTQARQRSQPADSNSHRYQRNLATMAIASYLRMIAVPHRLEASEHGLTLYVEELSGYVTCCPVSPRTQKCTIPEHKQDSPKGFLFVELCEPYHQAHVLGFVAQVSVSELPLSYLQPLSAFTQALEAAAYAPKISLSDWIANRIPGWLSPQDPAFPTLSAPSSAQPASLQPSLAMRGASLSGADALATIIERTTSDAIRWQAAEQLAYTDAAHPLAANIKAHSLSKDLSGLSVALLVGIISKPNETFLIGCRLYATEDSTASSSLPADITLKGIDDSGEGAATETNSSIFFEITPAVHGDPLEYLFTAEKGDRFSIHIHYQTDISTHSFVLSND